jgi:hypothetical protein
MTTADLRALTVRQPFAWQIMTGEKTIEYRSWETDYRGVFLVHVSSKVKLTRDEAARWPAADVYSVILGSVVLDHIEGQPGNFEWHLRDPRLLDAPIPCVGRLQLWKPPEAVLKSIPDLEELLSKAPPTRVPPLPLAPPRPKTSDELAAEFIARRKAEREAAETKKKGVQPGGARGKHRNY